MDRESVFNFNAGPAIIPTPVLQQAKDELLNWKGTGCSVLEISHRSKEFEHLIQQTQKNLTNLLNVPKNYKILFLQGGASLQFSSIPLNLLPENGVADYVISGIWSKKAYMEATKFGKVNIAFDGKSNNYTTISPTNQWKFSENSSYTYYCDNETVHGLEFPSPPSLTNLETNPGILVGDMSSNFLSKSINVDQFGLIFACAQKNFGVAGTVVIIVRDDLIGNARTYTPSVIDFKQMADHNSLLNTPPTFGIYLANLIFEWISKNGGVSEIEKINSYKSQKLYDFIDDSSIYRNFVDKKFRSKMNVICRITKDKIDEQLEKKFILEAEKKGLIGVQGHRSVGGLRFSIYNAMEMKGIDALIEFMKEFEEKNL